MADRTRLAAAGLFLALTLAAVPALLPIDLAGAGPGQRAEAAAQGPPASVAVVPPLVHLQGGDLTSPRTVSEHTSVPAGLIRLAVAGAAPRPHTVAPGETLWRISEDAGIGVEALAAANHLTLGAILRPGQVLMVPPVDLVSPRVSAATHEVAPGETLWRISRASGLGVETLAAANHLSVDAVLHPGQVLVIPLFGSSPVVQARSRGQAAPAGRDLLAMFQSEPLAGAAGPLVQPSDGMITSRFGWRIHPIFGTREFHTGVDIANRMGTPVRAAENGVVRFVGWMGGYGRLIIVAHANGLETSYSHLSAMLVTLGQRVVRGQVLGHMGSTGWSTGPHLLFEVRRNGVALDPLPLLQGTRGGVTATAAPPAPSTRAADADAPRAATADTPRAATADAPRATATTPAVAATTAGAKPAVVPTTSSPSEEHRSVTESLPNPAPNH